MGTPAMRRWSWIGLAAGFGLALVDLGVATLMGVQIQHQGVNLIIPVFAMFAATFAGFGWVAGRLAEALAALRDSQRRALEIEKLASLGRAAAGVAHEVRNPLGVIRSSAALLLERVSNGDQDQQKAARFIVVEVDRLDGFVRRLLDFARPVTPERRPTDLRTLLERVQMLAGPSLEVTVSEGPDLPVVDADLLSQAVLALALNARDAAGESGRVRVEAAAERSTLRIEVADDGPGVGEGDAGRIFEPFVTTRPRGTGLGLPTAQRIAEAHGGSLRLEGRGLGPEGRGARFVLQVPA
jgi:signal transduction histidine kinase